MGNDTTTLRLSYNPLHLFLGAPKRQGLRIGYMESALKGFYLNCIDTGISSKKLVTLLREEYHCEDPDDINELFRFLIYEGDRVSYQIMLPCLFSSHSQEEFEKTISERFLDMDEFIQHGKNLYKFIKYMEFRREPFIWMNDIERGIMGWDMGVLVCLARIALKCGYITIGEAWEYIEMAGEKCAIKLHTPDEIDKSFLIGRAMTTDNVDEWDRMLKCYSLIRQQRFNYLSRLTT